MHLWLGDLAEIDLRLCVDDEEADSRHGGEDGDVPTRECPPGHVDPLLPQDRAPQQPGQTGGEEDADGADVAPNGERDGRGAHVARVERGRVLLDDLGEEDGGEDVGAGDAAQEDGDGADAEDGGGDVDGEAREPGREGVGPAAVDERFDEHELAEGEGEEGEGKALDGGEEGGRASLEAGVESRELCEASVEEGWAGRCEGLVGILIKSRVLRSHHLVAGFFLD